MVEVRHATEGHLVQVLRGGHWALLHGDSIVVPPDSNSFTPSMEGGGPPTVLLSRRHPSDWPGIDDQMIVQLVPRNTVGSSGDGALDAME